MDKLFWVLARWFCADWKKSLLVVTPETVVRWHRAGFRLYWSLISRVKKQIGRKRPAKEIRNLIFRVVAENPTWGAPRIHGELLMLGFNVSERSTSRWMKRAPRDPDLARRWQVDDSPVARNALPGLFGPVLGFEVSGEAENGQDAIDKAELLRPADYSRFETLIAKAQMFAA